MSRLVKLSSGVALFVGGAALFLQTNDGRVAFVGLALGTVGLYLFARGVTADYIGYFQEINGPLESAKEAIANLVNAGRDKGHVQILTGTLSPDIYLQDPVFTALKRAVERGVQIWILLGEPDAGWDYWPWRDRTDKDAYHQFVEWVSNGRVKMSRTVRERLTPHFIVVDGAHVRIEDGHPKRKRGDRLQKRTAVIHYLESKLAARYAHRFSEYLTKAELLDVPERMRLTGS